VARSGCASCARSSISSKATGTSAPEQPRARPEAPSLGILGGTFNPPHRGHVALARHAREELGLERVVLMPVHTPPHKTAGVDPGPEHRLRMCRLAVEHEEGVSACGLEIERGGPSYTVDTLETIHAKCPDARLTFIVGADTARTLRSWHEPERMLELTGLAVAARAGAPPREVLDALDALVPERPQQGAGAVAFLAMGEVAVSSSQVRERVARGEPVEDLVGPAVAAYIAEHRLYAAPVGAVR
jgi:nicotinate-nucleotide adenylyltransferase